MGRAIGTVLAIHRGALPIARCPPSPRAHCGVAPASLLQATMGIKSEVDNQHSILDNMVGRALAGQADAERRGQTRGQKLWPDARQDGREPKGPRSPARGTLENTFPDAICV